MSDGYCFICERFTDHRSSSCPDRRRFKGVAVCTALALVLAGCSQDKPVPYQPVNIVADTYCAATKDLTWSVQDTSTTVDGVRRANAGRQAKCGAKKKQ